MRQFMFNFPHAKIPTHKSNPTHQKRKINFVQSESKIHLGLFASIFKGYIS